MSENQDSFSFVRWTARVVAALGLGFVFVPLIWNWLGELQSETVELYITGVGVPLLTFAGFLAVYLGFLSQREQNDLQREQLEQQQSNFQKDRFESIFFQLLRTHNQIVDDIGCEETRLMFRKEQRNELLQISGRTCFEQFYSEFEESFEEKADENNWTLSDVGASVNATSVYKEWYEDRKSQLNHYFNNLSKIISFVDESDAVEERGEKDRQFYIDLVIAQMSVPELVLFFYHEATLRERKDYVSEVYNLLGKYTFFDQIDPERSLIHEDHSNLYPRALGLER